MTELTGIADATVTLLPLWTVVAAAAVLGAIIGSFLGAALVRLPMGRSVVVGRSACDGCGRTLSVWELVPVLSFAVLRGKCRTCDARIGGWQIACELGGAGVAVGAVAFAAEDGVLAAMLQGWQLLLLGLLDLRHLWLPRVLTGLLALSGLAVAAARAWFAQGIAPLVHAAAGGILGFALLWLIARAYERVRGRTGMGAGDPPLLGAIGLWLGPLGVVQTMLGASVAGLLAAIVMLVSKRSIASDTALPLGTCLAVTAWPLFLMQGAG
ncbi:MAG: prepilin peptidase [Novosphingobium meiothermophilum]